MTDRKTIDRIIRYHLRLDGLTRATLLEIQNDLAKVIASIDNAISGHAASIRTVELGRSLNEANHTLRQILRSKLGESLDAVVDTSGTLALEITPNLVGSSVVAKLEIPLDAMAAVTAAPYDGMFWQEWGTQLADETIGTINSQLRMALSLGETASTASKRLQSVLGHSKTSAERLVRTAMSATANRARVAAMKNIAEVKGWQFVSVLDGRTSKICASLDGKSFAKDASDIPWPPRHPNCRSIIVPVTDIDEKLTINRPYVRGTKSLADMGPEYRKMAKDRLGDKWWRLSEEQRRKEIAKDRKDWQARNIGQVDGKSNYENWLKKQPASFQKEVLGPTRYRAWKRGLSIGNMATYDRELSVSELRQMYPAKFDGA